jgi:hypothetical protein
MCELIVEKRWEKEIGEEEKEGKFDRRKKRRGKQRGGGWSGGVVVEIG